LAIPLPLIVEGVNIVAVPVASDNRFNVPLFDNVELTVSCLPAFIVNDEPEFSIKEFTVTFSSILTICPSNIVTVVGEEDGTSVD
jgi:hypothetical protein